MRIRTRHRVIKEALIKEGYKEIKPEYEWCYEPYTNWQRPHFPNSILESEFAEYM